MIALRDNLGTALTSRGVYKRDPHNPDDYDNFLGRLSTALDVWKDSHGKPPSQDDIVKTIGPQLIQSHPIPGKLWGSHWPSEAPWFKQDTSTDDYKFVTGKIKHDANVAGLDEPTETELNRAYGRVQLQRLYPPKVKPTDGK